MVWFCLLAQNMLGEPLCQPLAEPVVGSQSPKPWDLVRRYTSCSFQTVTYGCR